MKFPKPFIGLLVSLLLALMLAACGDTATPATSGTTAASTTTSAAATTATSTTTSAAASTTAATTTTSAATTTAASTSASATTTSAAASNGKVTTITFYFPTAVEGPITKTFQGYADEFMKENPDIKVNTVFAGGYSDVLSKVQTELKGSGNSADVAIMLSTDIYTLVDANQVVPLDNFINAAADGKSYINDFYPAFMANSVAYGKTYGIPFQRSTPVLYYNKDMFKAAGLDDSKAPETFQEMADDAQKLTKPDGSVWGIKIPSDGFPYWLYQGFAISNGQNVIGDAANKVFFNTPAAIQGLTDFQSLVTKYHAMPKGVIVWGDTPKDFEAGKVAMIYHTTGSLTDILSKSKFNVGVGFLPKGSAGYGAPTGGGNLYLINNKDTSRQQAAWKFIQFLTQPDRLADWTTVTGYVAPRKSAWDTDTLKNLVGKYPQYGVARDQLQYAAKELSAHNSATVQQILGKAVQSVITGDKDPTTALNDAQNEANKLLAPYKS